MSSLIPPGLDPNTLKPLELATSSYPRIVRFRGETAYDKGNRYKIMHTLIWKGYEVLLLLYDDPDDGGSGLWSLWYRVPGGRAIAVEYIAVRNLIDYVEDLPNLEEEEGGENDQ